MHQNIGIYTVLIKDAISSHFSNFRPFIYLNHSLFVFFCFLHNLTLQRVQFSKDPQVFD